MTKEQLEKLYKAKNEKELLDIIEKEGIALSAEELEMVNGGGWKDIVKKIVTVKNPNSNDDNDTWNPGTFI